MMSVATLKRMWLLALSALWILPAGAAEPETVKPADEARLEFYNQSELTAKAERIVVADIGAPGEESVELKVHQTLKAPEIAAKYVDPDRMKRAADLLEQPEKANLPPLAPARAPVALKVTVDKKMKLPPQGTQAIFFLWERMGKLGETTYRVSHPQCIYDVDLLTQVQAGLNRPRALSDGRYLREWDRQMAERVRGRDADKALLKAKGGETVMALRLRAARPALSLRGDGSFSVTALVENTRGREQAIYDGPAGGYGARLWRKGSEPSTGVVLRVTMKGLVAGMDNSILGITDPTDFAAVPASSSMSKELFFDAKTFPVLKHFTGEYMLSVFFTTAQDGAGLALDGPAWSGTMISEEAPLRFGDPAAEQKAEK